MNTQWKTFINGSDGLIKKHGEQGRKGREGELYGLFVLKHLFGEENVGDYSDDREAQLYGIDASYKKNNHYTTVDFKNKFNYIYQSLTIDYKDLFNKRKIAEEWWYTDIKSKCCYYFDVEKMRKLVNENPKLVRESRNGGKFISVHIPTVLLLKLEHWGDTLSHKLANLIRRTEHIRYE